MASWNHEGPIDRRAVLRDTVRIGMALAAAGSAPTLFAQSSQQPVRVIVPFTPGTTPDLCARLLQPRLQVSLNRTFIVDNRAGASGLIGMDAVSKSQPDGNTLMFGTSTGLTLPFVYGKVPFDVTTSFAPITMLGHTNFALVVSPDVPAKTWPELKAFIAAQPVPFDYGSPGKGTFQHLCMEWISFLAETKMTHVPYKGSAPALADLMGGHVKAMIVPLHVAMPLVADGKLVVIGSTRRDRDAAYPTVTPLAEEGLSGLDADAWYAVWGPAGMSPASIATYGNAIEKALSDTEIKASLVKLGITPQSSSPDELARVSRIEYSKWGKLIKDIRLPPE